MAERLKTEIVILGALLCFGVLVLPFAIYAVGGQLVGEYRPGAGPLDLANDVWSALGRGELAAWILVAAPYAVVQLLRLAGLIWRTRPSVSRVTDPQGNR